VVVKLTWRAPAKPTDRYKVFVHIGAADAPPVAQNDAEPVAGFHPTDTWNAGEDIVDQRAVLIKPGTAPGRYGVYLGMYDGASGQRLTVASADGRVAGDRLWLGDITITR
jgi:mannosyltransferase